MLNLSIFSRLRLLFISIIIISYVKSADISTNSNSIIRTTNSVDIQICVQSAFLTPQRDLFLQALIEYLTQAILNNNALYLDRQYTTNEGALCYLFVYQAPGPENAVSVMERLSEQPNLRIPFASTTIQCSIQAAQWSGDNLSYLGAPFPGLWTVNDLILWGSCILTVIFLCMSGMCCYAFIILQRKSTALPLPFNNKQPHNTSTNTTHINSHNNITPSIVKIGNGGKIQHQNTSSTSSSHNGILKLPDTMKVKK